MTTTREITFHRLCNQQIRNPVLKQPAAVVNALGAMQAQDFAGALWSVGLRMPGGTLTAVLQALEAGQIIRTWLLRGTLHLVTPEDIRWILKLVAPRIIAGSAGRHRQLGLTGEEFGRSRDLFIEELQGGRHLTREELFRALSKAGISPMGQRGYHLLATAGLEGVICFGRPRGKQQTFALLDEWAPETGKTPGPAGALSRLAERYFSGHGPATLQDFVWWSGLTVTDAKAGITAAGDSLTSRVVGGKEYLSVPRDGDEGSGEPEVVLLPGFDEYILGYRDRSAALDPALAGKTVIGSNGMMLPTILVDGSVAGTWKRTVRKNTVTITFEPFINLDSVLRLKVRKAAEHYGIFMERPVSVEWSPARHGGSSHQP